MTERILGGGQSPSCIEKRQSSKPLNRDVKKSRGFMMTVDQNKKMQLDRGGGGQEFAWLTVKKITCVRKRG